MSQDNIYFNCQINPSSNNQEAIFDESLTIALLQNPADYYCSVIRFAVPLNNIPIFKFPLDVNQSNANVSTFILGITTAGGVKYPVKVIYVPDNNIVPPSTTRVTAPYFTKEQALSDYFNIFSVVQVLELFNTAIASAVVASGIGVTAPFYIYTPSTQLISCIVTAAFIGTGASLFVNDNVKNYISSFRFYDNITPTVGDDFVHIFSPLPFGGASPYQFIEEENAMSLWFDVRRIIIKTNSLPVKFESVPGTSVAAGFGAVAYQPILTDFVVGIDDFSLQNSIAIYNPTSQYRLVDMTSNAPIVKVHISIWYADKYGDQFPLTIDANQSASVKLGFFHRSMYIADGSERKLNKYM